MDADDLDALIDQRRRAALSLDDFSLLSDLDVILRRYIPNADVHSALDEVRERVLGRRHPADIKDLHALVKNCRRCPEASPTLPKGNVEDPHIVFVLQQFGGDQIKLLSDALKSCKYSSKTIALTSLVRCGFSEITDAHVAACESYLWEEIKAWQPRCTVLLGAGPSKFFFGDTFKITKDHGQRYWLDEYCFVPTYAPNHAKNHPNMWDQLLEDLKQVKTWSE